MRTVVSIVVTLFLLQPVIGSAQDIAEPFKVGTFEIDGSPRVGIVLRDKLIIELNAANTALERNINYPAIPVPADMIELIERYDYGLKRRLYEIVNDHVGNDMLGDALCRNEGFKTFNYHE